MQADELLRAIVANPDDTAARLVYADALLQAGDPRGELIALACKVELDATQSARAAELSEQVKPMWLEQLGETVTDIYFDRGMPVTAEVWIQSANREPLAALDRAPIRNVKLRFDEDAIDVDAAAPLFARDPRTARLRTLDLTWEGWGEAAMRALLGAELRELHTLYIGDYDGQTYAIDALVGARIDALETLELFGDSYADLEEALPLLVSSARAPTLRRLGMPNCSLYANACEVLASALGLAELHELDLSGGSNTTNRVGNAGLIALARSPHLGKLSRLSLGNNQISDEGVAALAEPDTLVGLRHLALNSARISAEVLGRVLATRILEGLFVGGCHGLGDDGVRAIVDSPHVAKLRALNLAGTGVTEAGVRTLIDSSIVLEYLVIDRALKPLLEARFGAAMS